MKKVLLIFACCFTVAANAQWQVGDDNAAAPEVAQNDSNQAAIEAQLLQFEKDKCSNGGPETKAFIDFSTQDAKEMAYVEEVSQRFSQTIQEQKLGVLFGENSARSVQFIFELNGAGGVTSLTVFAKDEDAGLRDFVTRLVMDSVPYPSFENTVDPCFKTVVMSAILDF